MLCNVFHVTSNLAYASAIISGITRSHDRKAIVHVYKSKLVRHDDRFFEPVARLLARCRVLRTESQTDGDMMMGEAELVTAEVSEEVLLDNEGKVRREWSNTDQPVNFLSTIIAPTAITLTA